jgi:imidazolonepropionase-like amidohydrolase
MHARWLPALWVLGCGATSDEIGTTEVATSSAPGSSGTTSEGTTCSSSTSGVPTSSSSGAVVGSGLLLLDGYVVGVGVTDIKIVGGEITEVGELAAVEGDEVVDLSGKWVTPAFIDSHVHLIYLNEPMLLAAGGVAAGVDMAAPVAIFEADLSPMRVVAAGPMITAIDGYPTQSWGANGYGLECADAAAATAAVEQLHDLGAGLIKLPVMASAAQLDDAALTAAVARAHELGLRVASHAMGENEARRAGLAGADVLAHTPTQPLSDETIALWADRAVVSTVGAFGGSAGAVDNLKKLHAAGARVLYGTDFGNSSVLGIDAGELALMVSAGMTPAEVLAAGTSAPAEFWGPLAEPLGALTPGKDGSLLVLNADPLVELATLGSPSRVYVRGVRVDPG